MIIKQLSECDNKYVEMVAELYMQEWGCHYKDEWNIHSIEEMIEDICRLG